MVYKIYTWGKYSDAVENFIRDFENELPVLHQRRKYMAIAFGHSVHTRPHLVNQVLKEHDVAARDTGAWVRDIDYWLFQYIGTNLQISFSCLRCDLRHPPPNAYEHYWNIFQESEDALIVVLGKSGATAQEIFQNLQTLVRFHTRNRTKMSQIYGFYEAWCTDICTNDVWRTSFSIDRFKQLTVQLAQMLRKENWKDYKCRVILDIPGDYIQDIQGEGPINRSTWDPKKWPLTTVGALNFIQNVAKLQGNTPWWLRIISLKFHKFSWGLVPPTEVKPKTLSTSIYRPCIIYQS